MRRGLITLLITGLVACADESGEACFEVRDKGPEGTVCGYTQGELEDLTDAIMPLFPQACFPLDECPNECTEASVIESYVLPELYEVFTDYNVESAQALCREDDVASDQCCYFALVTGHSGG